MKIVVLHDQVKAGAAPDLLDNLDQARQVSGLLKKLGHTVRRIPFNESVYDEKRGSGNILLKQKPDLVFNLVEAPEDQGRLIHMAPMLLDRLGLCYTGSGVKALTSTSNKLRAKLMLHSFGLPTPDWFYTPVEGRSSGSFQPGNYIIKSVWEHGSFGLNNGSVLHCEGPEELTKQIIRRTEQDGGDCFAERFISGREFNLSLIAGESEPEVLPPSEIVFMGFSDQEHQMVDYAAKWDPTSPHFNGTPRRFDFSVADADLLRGLKRSARQCWELFGLRGWARVDFRIDEVGMPWVLEVNANPCLALDAGFMAAVKRAGFKPEQAVDSIIKDAFSAPHEPVEYKRSEIHAGGNA